MEYHTADLKTEVLGYKTLYSGKTKRIDLKKYYDLKTYTIDEGVDTTKFDTEVNFEIKAKTIKYNWSCIPATTHENWEVYVNGERFDKHIEITGYRILKTKVVLEGCTGCG